MSEAMSGYYPVFLHIKGRRCVVVGGGEVAQRKAEALLEAGARVRVIAPSLTPRLAEMAAAGAVEAEPRPYISGDLKGAFLTIAATDNAETNALVTREARRRRVLLNVVDQPRACSFIVPSVVRRGELVLAISTGGLSPALARKVREELEAYLGPEYALLARVVGRVRRRLRHAGVSPDAWNQALDAGLLELLRRGEVARAEQRLEEALMVGVAR